jgi:TAP-like protein
VGNTYDPSTPYVDALTMIKELARSRLLTLAGYGHSALINPSACVNSYEAAYFLTGALPPAGRVCHQDRQPFS